MNSFWVNLMERLRSNCAWLFVPALLLFLGVALIGGGIRENFPPDVFSEERFIYFLPGITLLVTALILWVVRPARAQRGRKSAQEQLSRDELSKARSKLKSDFKSAPVKLPPETDLKY